MIGNYSRGIDEIDDTMMPYLLNENNPKIYSHIKVKIIKSDNPERDMEDKINEFLKDKHIVDIKTNTIDKKKYIVMIMYLT